MDENNLPAVSFTMNRAGAVKFGKLTTENLGKPMAVILDRHVEDGRARWTSTVLPRPAEIVPISSAGCGAGAATGAGGFSPGGMGLGGGGGSDLDAIATFCVLLGSPGRPTTTSEAPGWSLSVSLFAMTSSCASGSGSGSPFLWSAAMSQGR